MSGVSNGGSPVRKINNHLQKPSTEKEIKPISSRGGKLQQNEKPQQQPLQEEPSKPISPLKLNQTLYHHNLNHNHNNQFHLKMDIIYNLNNIIYKYNTTTTIISTI
ncbi:hypothetical protein ACTFIV_003372 [Dictyostelium citrinum]